MRTRVDEAIYKTMRENEEIVAALRRRLAAAEKVVEAARKEHAAIKATTGRDPAFIVALMRETDDAIDGYQKVLGAR